MKLAVKLLIAFFLLGALLFFISKRRGDSSTITLFGNVDIRQVDLGFRVFGKVEALFVDEGDLITPGQLLAKLDKTPYLEQLAQNEGAVRALTADLQNAEILLERRALLTPSGGVSKQEFDDAAFRVKQLKGRLDEALAALESATTALNDTELFSPSEGTILTRIREAGSVVSTGVPVFTLSLSTPLWIRAYVSEPELGRIYPGMEATIETDSGTTYKGRVGFISPVAEFTPKTVETTTLRTDLVYRIRVVVDNPDRTLKQGMPVTVTLWPSPS